MKNKIFNTTLENMLRVLLMMDVIGVQINIDRLTALDFISIYGKKCKVLDKNLHGDNEFGFAEFANKRERITEAVKLAVINDYITVENTAAGFLYSIGERGKKIVEEIQTPYAKSYMVGAKIVNRKFKGIPDEALLKYINNMATETKEV